MRKKTSPEKLFLDRIKMLITNLLIDNINYKNSFRGDFKADTIERAKYILEEIEKTEHLFLEKDL